MAYMNQERKKELAPAIKAVMKKYGIKGSIAVHNYSTLVVNIREGAIDFGNSRNMERWSEFAKEWKGHAGVNPYHIDRSWEGEAEKFLTELKDAMMKGNHDNSDIMTDYFDVGWYVDINIGSWNKDYKVAS